jgi:hypothetical protein
MVVFQYGVREACCVVSLLDHQKLLHIFVGKVVSIGGVGHLLPPRLSFFRYPTVASSLYL